MASNNTSKTFIPTATVITNDGDKFSKFNEFSQKVKSLPPDKNLQKKWFNKGSDYDFTKIKRNPILEKQEYELKIEKRKSSIKSQSKKADKLKEKILETPSNSKILLQPI